MTALLTALTNAAHPLFWMLAAIVAAMVVVTVERIYRAHRRAAVRSARVWFEYSQMAAHHSEQLRGR
jgi:hypothetical protein